MIRRSYILLNLCLCLPFFLPGQNMSLETLQDKIKGGWAGQAIGVTFGGPVEFRYNGTMIQSYQPLPWYKGYVAEMMKSNDGLYDDLYLDLTWVEVLEKYGLHAPSEHFAKTFAYKGYKLWHANQAARYNILHGMEAPHSGHWMNNPHADCIDFQIEADFAGLMSPGMSQSAALICDRVGHIMNYGDGWYGGVFIASMYSWAFLSSNIPYIVSQSLKSIPANTRYHQVIADVLSWYKKYPKDWTKTWLEVQNKWSEDIGCPDGVYAPFNIDATINSAYVVIGLLYGKGDFTQTIEITTRCGQDADCNPSSSAGILGTILGYHKIPAFWLQGLEGAEDLKFAHTDYSLNKAYEVSLKHAIEHIRLNGGWVEEGNVRIAAQKPAPVKFEQSFENTYPSQKIYIGKVIEDVYTYTFEGTGIVVKGYVSNWDGIGPAYSAKAEIYLDEIKIETVELPSNFQTRRHELFWKYGLPKGRHTLRIKLLNRDKQYDVRISDILTYSNTRTQIENVYQFGRINK